MKRGGKEARKTERKKMWCYRWKERGKKEEDKGEEEGVLEIKSES